MKFVELLVETISILMFFGFIFTVIITSPVWGPVAFISYRMDWRREGVGDGE